MRLILSSLWGSSPVKSIGFFYVAIIAVTCINFSIGAITNYQKLKGLLSHSFVGQKSGEHSPLFLSHRLKSRCGHSGVPFWSLGEQFASRLVQVMGRILWLMVTGLRFPCPPCLSPGCCSELPETSPEKNKKLLRLEGGASTPVNLEGQSLRDCWGTSYPWLLDMMSLLMGSQNLGWLFYAVRTATAFPKIALLYFWGVLGTVSEISPG